jgi:hypothetical protein
VKTLITKIGTQIDPADSSKGPIFSPLTASATFSAIPKSSTGSDQSTSRVRAITASTQPLK